MAKSEQKPKSPFTGRWRITSMSAWEQDFIDEEEEGYVEFDGKGNGEFHFGYVHGQMNCKLTTRDGEPAVEWTWDGNDEMDPAQGRGWAVVKRRTARDDFLSRRRRFRVRRNKEGGASSKTKEAETMTSDSAIMLKELKIADINIGDRHRKEADH